MGRNESNQTNKFIIHLAFYMMLFSAPNFFLPGNFTKELLENDHESLYKTIHSYLLQTEAQGHWPKIFEELLPNMVMAAILA